MAMRRALPLAMLAALATPVLADDASALTALRAGGHVALIVHGATGSDDAGERRSGDCAARPALSDEGREQSRRLGRFFAREAIAIDKVLASPSCAAEETAREAFGKFDEWSALAGFRGDAGRGEDQLKRVKQRVGGFSARRPKGTVVMVTHEETVAALAKRSGGAGEIVVVRPDGCCGLRVVGRFDVR